MGKNLITQARGKGGPTYRSPGFRFIAPALHKKISNGLFIGTVIDIVHCPGHYAPLMKIKYNDGEEVYSYAPDGILVGETIECGDGAAIKRGNTLSLKNIPEGTEIYNIESQPGDGGKFARSSGCSARIIGKINGKVTVELPSKKQKMLNEKCRASIGMLSGGGRVEKPIVKAGIAHFKHKARNKKYPHITGSAQNAVDHPFGNKRSSRKSKARPVGRNASPGRKVGYLAASRTGKRSKSVITV